MSSFTSLGIVWMIVQTALSVHSDIRQAFR